MPLLQLLLEYLLYSLWTNGIAKQVRCILPSAETTRGFSCALIRHKHVHCRVFRGCMQHEQR